MFLIDMLLVVACLSLALMLRFEASWQLMAWGTYQHIGAILCIYGALLMLGGVYDILWRYAGVNEALRMCVICAAGGVMTLLLNWVAHWNCSRAVLCIQAVLVLAATGGVRLLWRILTRKKNAHEKTKQVLQKKRPRLLIVGAGTAASYVLKMCQDDPGLGEPILLVDDNPGKQHLRLRDIQVKGKIAEVPQLAEQYDIQDIIIAIPSLRGDALANVVGICRQTSCRVRISSRIQNSDNLCRRENMYVRELNISDFLSRDEIQLDTRGIAEYLTGSTVMVTGGGGSIGSELCRQIIRFSPKQLMIFDIYENCAYELECELRQKYGADCPVTVLIGSVRDRERLQEVFDAYHPDVVFHAAAHKHVPLMEVSPAEAIKNNVFGTLNTLEAAGSHGVKRFVLLSTDKAVNPTNIMGASKRITEMLIQYYAGKTEMKCMAVRFGNVLGSHGSVIPLFERQIKAGGPVTVTHPDIIRYFMTIPEAAQLVLQAGSIAESGSIYVLDMGKPVRIYDLAEQLIRFYDYEPNVTMNIKITGLRPGEKLYEELMSDEERNTMARTEHDRIMVASPLAQDNALFEMQLEVLRTAANHNDARVIEAIRRIVSTYTDEKRETA